MAVPSVAIVSDSAAALPYGLQAKHHIHVVPLHLQIGHEVFTEGVNISAPRVIDALLDGRRVRTFEAPVAELSRAYRECAEAGATHIVSIHMSSTITEMVTHAEEAAATSPIPVTVIDSGTMSMEQGFIVLAAAAVAGFGETPEVVAAATMRAMQNTRMLFTVSTLDYVHRDGQIPGLIKFLGNSMNLRPILAVRDGKVKVIGKERETGPGRERVRSEIQAYAATLTRPAVAYALVGGSATDEGLAIETTGFAMEESPGASMAAHAGPGTYVAAASDMPPEFMLTL